MAGEDLTTYTGQATIAYQDALNQARNSQNALLRQYGFVAPNSSGAYTVEGAQAAFDPNSMFDKNTGGVDQARLDQALKSLQVGGTGVLSDVTRSGVSAEANVVAETRSRLGEFGGGLMNQRRQLAENVAAGELGQSKGQFINALGQGLSPIGGAYQQLQTAQATDTASRLASEAASASIVNNVPTEAPAGSAASTPPKDAKNYQRWTNPVNGKKFQFVNGKWKTI